MTMTTQEFTTLFTEFGCDEKQTKAVLKNASNTAALADAIGDLKSEGKAEAWLVKAVVGFATEVKVTPLVEQHRPLLMQYLKQGKISTQPQIKASYKYFKNMETFDLSEFETKCGVGIKVTLKQIQLTVKKVIEEVSEELAEERYHYAKGKLLAKCSQLEPWAEGKALRDELTCQIESFLGPKTEQDKAKKKKKKPATPKQASTSQTEAIAQEDQVEKDIEKLYEGRDIDASHNSPEILAEHKRITGGKLRTRFPPEPNGFLHIGHAKAMNFNFGLAKRNNGECYLRFDDTNPSAEDQVYVNSIVENVKWMGHTPTKITTSSEVFQELFDLAVDLIKRGKAYVCHLSQEEIRQMRVLKHEQEPSPYRNRSIEENLKEFEKMRKGMYAEGEATLRMKIDITSLNPCMWDPIAYRIKYEPHQHSGDKWCIYPSYDYTHCIVDSLEHITHSLCTLEFEIRRDSYYWLLEALDLYRPVVWEYSRLNITRTVLSKRKLLKLVKGKYVMGWDDPRLLTINGLRRRGYTPTALNKFCDLVGVTRAENTISIKLLESVIRTELDAIAPRTMAVLHPLKVVVSNYDETKCEKLETMVNPRNKEQGMRLLKMDKILYIERSDFRMTDAKGYFGLAPGKTAHLKGAFNIRCDKVVEKNGQIEQLECSLDYENKEKVKGNLHWIAESNSLPAKVRLFDYLFTVENPSTADLDFLEYLNPESLVEMEQAIVDKQMMKDVQPFLRFQFERTGYFVVDPATSSASSTYVFNRIVPLRESKEKKNL